MSETFTKSVYVYVNIEKLWNIEMIKNRRVHLIKLLLGVDGPKIERQITRAFHIEETP